MIKTTLMTGLDLIKAPSDNGLYLCLMGCMSSERSVVVITGRCQRLNPGSSPGARTKVAFLHK